MAWKVDSTTPITAANQQTEGRIRLHPGACADLRGLLQKTSDPDEFLLLVGWSLIVVVDAAADQVDYLYKAPDGRQWSDRQCGTAAVGGVFGLGSWLVAIGVLAGGYLLWKKYGKKGKKKTRRSTKRRKRS